MSINQAKLLDEGWNRVDYDELEDVNAALYDLLLARDEPNAFDLKIAERLCKGYSPSTVCSMLTNDQKEIVVIGVEFEHDCGNIVSPNLKSVYEHIIEEQSQSEGQSMQM